MPGISRIQGSCGDGVRSVFFDPLDPCRDTALNRKGLTDHSKLKGTLGRLGFSLGTTHDEVDSGHESDSRNAVLMNESTSKTIGLKIEIMIPVSELEVLSSRSGNNFRVSSDPKQFVGLDPQSPFGGD